MSKRAGESSGGGKPLHLLQSDPKTGKFVLGEDALTALRAVKTPIAIASVCGRARQGKRWGLHREA
jgi:Xaa-Pro aminopeptidase